ncbi:MAG: right-handed parallel beta-helix repeat-containing protein [Candidatus Zixiibacteriota bacterium]
MLIKSKGGGFLSQKGKTGMAMAGQGIRERSRFHGSSMVLVVLLAAIVLCVQPCANAADSVCDGRCFYVDSLNGDDSGTGLSPDDAWRTLERLEAETLQPGDLVHLRKDRLWRETLRLTGSGSEEEPIRVMPYGSGASPIVSGADIIEGWDQHSTLDLYLKQLDWYAGVILLDGAAMRFVPWTSEGETLPLLTPGDYTFDVDLLIAYVHLQEGETPEGHLLEVSHRTYGLHVAFQAHIHVEDIVIEGAAVHGVYVEQSSDVDLHGLVIRYCGGRWFPEHSFYVGNGVEWSWDTFRASISDSTVRDIFDSALSPQQYNILSTVEQIRIEGCRLLRNGMSGVEIAVHAPYVGSSIRDVLVQGNLIEETGKGWSGARPGSGVWVYNHGGALFGATIEGIVLRDNVVADSADHGIWLSSHSGQVLLDRNTIRYNDQDGVRVYDEMPLSSTGVDMTYNVVHGNAGNGFDCVVPHGGTYRLWNNTFYDNGDDSASTCNICTVSAGAPGEVINNVIYGERSMCRYDPNDTASTTATHHNLYYRSDGYLLVQGGETYLVGELQRYKDESGRGQGSLEDDPRFISLLEGNFRLRPDSPARDTGTPLGLEADRDGSPVPATNVDMGAYERPPDVGAGRVPDQPLWPGSPLVVEKDADGRITLTWASSCRTTDDDFGVYEGQLGDFGSHTPHSCSTNGAMTLTLSPGEGNRYFIVVPQGDGLEGSYGTNSAGYERPVGDPVCLQQGIGSCSERRY